MSQTSATTSSRSNYQSIFDNALEVYRKKTGKDLRSHPLLSKLENCGSPDAVLNTLRQEIPGFDQSGSSNDDSKLTKWLDPTIKVLIAFSSTVGDGVSLVSPTLDVQDKLGRWVTHFENPHFEGVPTRWGHFQWNRRPSIGQCPPRAPVLRVTLSPVIVAWN